jgi:hypothetical protein
VTVVVIVLGVVVLALVAALVQTQRRARALGQERDAIAGERDRVAAESARRAERLVELEQALQGAADALDEAEAVARSALWAERLVDGPLWRLEEARSRREWQGSLAPTDPAREAGGGVSARLRAALLREVDRLREEVGVQVRVEPVTVGEMAPRHALVVLRAAQEVLAAAAPHVEELTVRVGTEDDALSLSVRGEGWDGADPGATLAATGEVLAVLGGWLRVIPDGDAVEILSSVPRGR